MLNIDKMTYSIGQAAEFADVAQSTIRYWETVITALKPQKTPGGTRRYSRSDIELIGLIKDLLHIKGYTIKGANLYIKNYKSENQNEPEQKDSEPEKSSDSNYKELVNRNMNIIYQELKLIRRILE